MCTDSELRNQIIDLIKELKNNNFVTNYSRGSSEDEAYERGQQYQNDEICSQLEYIINGF